jgi:hypothetical protein
MKNIYVCLVLILLTGCSMFGKSGVEIGPYRVIKSVIQEKIDLQHYEKIVLVSVPMLSKPFQGQVQEGKIFTPEYSSVWLLKVINDVEPKQSGKVFAWDGKEVPA